jgi:hypothetical protein
MGSPPVILIRIDVESKAPRVLMVCMNDAEEARIVDWLRSQDDLAELVARAIEIGEELQAA